jgi:hypothetical protein
MLTDYDTELDTELSCPTALVYEGTEEARLLLGSDAELSAARAAIAEAAYYLSDSIDPDERIGLLAVAEDARMPAWMFDADSRTRAAETTARLSLAAGEVEELLRGPPASSELRIALRAIRRAIGHLTLHLGVEANAAPDVSLPTRVAAVLGLRR